MDTFFKATGCVLSALVIYLILAKQNKDFSLLLSVGVCVMIALIAVRYLEPVFDLVDKLQAAGNMDSQIVGILLKSVGITLIAEIVGQICQDSGNGSMAKTVQLLASGVILWLCVPMFTGLIELVEEILVAI